MATYDAFRSKVEPASYARRNVCAPQPEGVPANGCGTIDSAGVRGFDEAQACAVPKGVVSYTLGIASVVVGDVN